MTPASDLLCSFVLEKSGDESLALRVRLYRALASTIPETSERFVEFTALADELAAIEARHDQLVLDFKRRAES